MGFITADIVKQDDDYVWKGEKNLNIYETQFEAHLISRVCLHIDQINIIIVKRGIQLKELRLDAKSQLS